jgi:hypothetical protein
MLAAEALPRPGKPIALPESGISTIWSNTMGSVRKSNALNRELVTAAGDGHVPATTQVTAQQEHDF